MPGTRERTPDTPVRDSARRIPRERVPPLIAAGATLAALIFIVPLVGLLWRAPWSSMWSTISSHDARAALRLSLKTSLAATAIAVVLGVPLAWVQARVEYPGRRLVRAVTLLPMVLPPVVGGIALLLALGKRGLVGQYLDHAGVHLPVPCRRCDPGRDLRVDALPRAHGRSRVPFRRPALRGRGAHPRRVATHACSGASRCR